jgi:hypothetical protein
MIKRLLSPAIAQWLSASVVAMAGLIIGKGAAHGMSTAQWGFACLILASAIMLAVLIWYPPHSTLPPTDDGEEA